MIRSVVAIFVFALVLCAYIVNTGPAQRNIAGELAALAAVSRAQTESLLPDTPLPEPTFLMPSTRLNLVPDSLDRTVDIILSDLGIRKRNADLSVGENGTLLAEVSRVNGSALQYRTTLESLIVDAVQSAKNDRDIQESVNAAALKELFPVPASLVDTNGKIDTAALLDIIVNEAQIAAGDPAKERFTPAKDAVTIGEDGGQLYRVAAGDSLARVAKMFYRDPSQHVEIWAANLGQMSSGYQLTEGQELFIP